MRTAGLGLTPYWRVGGFTLGLRNPELATVTIFMFKAMIRFLCFCSLLVAAHITRGEVPAGNVWPNPTFESGDALDSSSGTPVGWNRGGNNAALCEVSVANAVSPTHSLLVNDTDTEGYAEWYSDLDLAGVAGSGDQVDIQWYQIYSTSGGEMRVTVLFFTSADTVAGTFHFVVNGDSPG